MSNYIFLDIDGVLNSVSIGIEEDKLKLLNDLILRTNAIVIISSSWRLESSLYLVLKKHILNIKDKTSDLFSRDTTIEEYNDIRVMEIREYIKDNNIEKSIDKFVVIDDLDLNIENLHRTDMTIGLTKDICLDVERFFSE